MGKRNPYRVAEKIGAAVGYTFLALIVVTLGTAVVVTFGVWSLLFFPGLAAVVLLAWGLVGIELAWKRARDGWYARNSRDVSR